MNSANKDLLTSKTTWGVVVSFIAMLALQFGWDIGDQGQWVETIVGFVGLAFALYGRVMATTQIGSVAGVSVKPEANDNSNEHGV